MLESVFWFLGQLMLAALAFFAGRQVCRRVSVRTNAVLMIISLAFLLVWGIRLVRPTLFFHLFPLDVLVYVEGTGNVPFFTFFVGLIWDHPTDPRARQAGPPVLLLASIYFIWNGLWMVMPYPHGRTEFVDEYMHPVHGGVIPQSTNETCVAAAAASAMLASGINQPISEAEMIRLTDTRWLRGSSVARAVRGLRRHLEGTNIEVDMLAINADAAAAVAGFEMPVLAPIKSGYGAVHMVVIYGHPPDWRNVFVWTLGLPREPPEEIPHGTLFGYLSKRFNNFPKHLGDYVIIGNPLSGPVEVEAYVPRGIEVMTIERFRKLYAGPAVVFRRTMPDDAAP
jgi:hypothetical protein